MKKSVVRSFIKIRHWNLEGPLNGGLIVLSGGSIGQVRLGLPKRKTPKCNT